MGLFGGIKRVFGRGDNIDEIGDIRSHVIGENEDPYGSDEPPMMSRMESAPELPEVSKFRREPMGFGPSPMGEREPIELDRSSNREYDIMDKLNIIEAQLSAIRSQTETINERLKNLEMRVGTRRY